MTQVFMWSAKLAYVHGQESDSTIRNITESLQQLEKIFSN